MRAIFSLLPSAVVVVVLLLQGLCVQADDIDIKYKRLRNRKSKKFPAPSPTKLYGKSSKSNGGKKGKAQAKKKTKWTVSITYPPPTQTYVPQLGELGGRTLDIEGVVIPYSPGAMVEAIGFGVTAPILESPSGFFRLRGIILPEGEAEIVVSVTAADGSHVGEATLKAMYSRPSDVSGSISQEGGGSVEVTDQDSPVAGAKMEVPPGSATRDFLAQIIHDPQHVPVLPFRHIQIGPPVLFVPETESFLGGAKLSIPFTPDRIPDTVDSTYAKVLRLSGDGWGEVMNPVSIFTENLLTFDVSALDARAYMPVVEVPLASDQAIIETWPAQATLYVDGVPYGKTPALLNNLYPGEHTLKLFIPLHDELFFQLDTSPPLSQGAVIRKVLKYSADPKPTVRLEDSLDGFETSDTFVEIVASVSFEGEALNEGVGIISINGKDFVQTVMDGVIRGFVSLREGHNRIEVRANGPNGSTGVSAPAIITSKPSQVESRRFLRNDTRKLNSNAIKIVLSWSTVGTDIDLHVFDPEGNHATWRDRLGIPNANIDVDDQDGPGREIFYYQNPVAGSYRVAVDAYRISTGYSAKVRTKVFLEVSVGGNLMFSESYDFTSDDHDGTNGSPVGANPSAFWDAFSFEVGSLVITSVKTNEASVVDQQAIFTTLAGENEIFIITSAPDSVEDSDIRYDIEEVVEGFKVDSPSTVGRETSFMAKHRSLPNLVDPSNALEFKIIAYTESDGERQYESAPFTAKQDIRSQIRQEYVDKHEYDPSFSVPIPARNQIISGTDFNFASPFFTFDEISAHSDYSDEGLTVVGYSVSIANTLRRAWGFPLIASSVWRNPRRNDRVGGVLNSSHQTGNAIDLHPSLNSEKWPSAVPGCSTMLKSFDETVKALHCVAQQTFDPNEYFVKLYSGSHVHIGRHTSGDVDGLEKDSVDQSQVLQLVKGALTILGEEVKSEVYWPGGSASGVTLGIGYDIGSRETADVKSQLMLAGMSEQQAAVIAGAAGLKGDDAKIWVEDNHDTVGVIDESIIRSLFSAELPKYADSAKALATDTAPSPAPHFLNARSREVIEGKPLGTYVMTESQWGNLHPAMVELITDMRYQGGYYAYDRVAKVNSALIANDGNHLEQFKSVAQLYDAEGGGLSYMDTYAMRLGESPSNTETFYGVPADDIRETTYRRNRIRRSFIQKNIDALERGASVEMISQATVSVENECNTDNTYGVGYCSPGPNGCYTLRASFVRNAIMTCFPNSLQPPTTYLGHSGYGNSMDVWHSAGGYGIKVAGVSKADMDEFVLWLMTNNESLKIYYVIWYNRIWNPSRDEFGVWWDCEKPLPDGGYRCICARQGTCADVTQGHYDHVHLTVKY